VRLALYTDSVSERSFDGALDFAQDLGLDAVEIAAGGQSPAPHMNLSELLSDRGAVDGFRDAFERRGIELTALNCSAWPLHPVHDRAHRQLIRDTIELAGRLGVRTIVSMSGCGGDAREDTTINWVWYPWPPDAVALLERQWRDVIDLWRELAAHAERHGVERIALELHPLHLAYNVPTLLRLREAVGPIIGANVDPSHFFWQQIDPIAVVEALGESVYHVHLKDSQVLPEQVALTGVLDNRPFADPRQRAWVFRTVGRAHDAVFWSAFFEALAAVRYEGSLSIENEDVEQPQEEGVAEAAEFARAVLAEGAARRR
jgi:sugar phosphate isomerase/epimerase